MNHMHEVILHSLQHPDLTPKDALADIASSYVNNQNANPAQAGKGLNMPPNGIAMPGGARTPNMAGAAFPPGQMPNGMSPALANQLLPQHSPAMGHTPSPALGNMPPPMAHQLSQQSATGSPSIGNKRRRPSGVKTEGSEDGDVKVRQSPSMRPGAGPPKKVRN